MLYLTIKALHLIAVICWFAALFYLPRLYVYHAMVVGEATGKAGEEAGVDEAANARFKRMERRLYYGIGCPAMLASWVFGLVLLWLAPAWLQGGWLHAKLSLVVGLTIYHLSMGHYRKVFVANRNIRTHRFYRYYNEIPILALMLIILLAVLKPF